MNRTCNISVLLPTYQRACVLPRAIDSVLAQTFPVGEIIVVDDGSTDDTAAVVARYGPSVRYLRQANAGAAAARNAGIAAAAGDWIAFLDSDDEWLPHKLQRQAEALDRCPHLRWCAAAYVTCREGEDRPSRLPPPARRELDFRGYWGDYFTAAGRGVLFPTPGMLIETSLLREVGGFDAGLSEAEDLDLWGRVALLAPAIGYVAEPCFRIHPTAGSLSQAGRRMRSLAASMEKTAGLAAVGSPGQLNRYLRYARPRAFRMLLKAAARNGDGDPETARTLEAVFPPTIAERAVLGLLRRMPARLARSLEWRVRAWHAGGA